MFQGALLANPLQTIVGAAATLKAKRHLSDAQQLALLDAIVKERRSSSSASA